ncbi:DUF3693 domain-containing protein [Noviherbaspirillum sedimenti]|uniref:HTH cro/C1-type domain-containing protein n=1 Tax=Noviherbaspirillum sedimenti TaxID=2320865 RepID=A0A3A3FZY6_9BURK|nr:DUF3693 domain-containing protein [Noviherbaspirillum sedimenti]RJG00955.1 hypothetical protein D3878_04605 [Noviherbaspirillum sedimenti]
MNQTQLIDAAKQQGGLTSDYKLAQALGVSTGRVSSLRNGDKAADEAEIAMLADMAGIDLHIALAAVHKNREKNPAKRAYWEKISMQFASVALAVTLVFTGFAGDARAGNGDLKSYKLCEISARSGELLGAPLCG